MICSPVFLCHQLQLKNQELRFLKIGHKLGKICNLQLMSFKFTAQVVQNLPLQFDKLKRELKQIRESKVNKSIRFCAFDVNYQPLPLIY